MPSALVVAVIATNPMTASDQSLHGEPAESLVIARRRRGRRRRSAGRARMGVGTAWPWLLGRLCRALVRAYLVVGVSLVAGAPCWPAVVVGALMLLSQLALVSGVALGCVRLLRLAALLETGSRAGMWWALGVAVAEAGGTAEPLVPSVMGAASTSTQSQGPVAVRVEGDRARIVIDGPVILDLPTAEEADERLAIVLCRLLQGTAGKPLLSHQRIADAFGKGSRQACHNHMQQLDRAGGSLARMVLEGQRGRRSNLHPLVLERITEHWERNPLATFGETCSWLATQQLGADVPLPTAEELGTVRRIGGNLVLMHNAVARLLERNGTGAALRPGLLLDRLFEVVDEQDRRLRAAGIEPAPLGGALAQEVTAAGTAERGLSRTGQTLVTWLTRLTAPPSRADDAELSEQVGTALLAPLHFGALYCLLGLSIGQVAALVGRSKSVVYRGLVALEQALTELDPFPAAANFSGVLAIDEKWVKIPKSFSEQQRAEGKKWRYGRAQK